MVCRVLVTSILLAVSGVTMAMADDVTDEIDRARLLYNQGKIGQAKQSLDMAASMMTQRKAALLGQVLPPPLAGWTAQAPDISSSAASVLGAGVSVSRIYLHGPERCIVSIVGDSPAIAMVNLGFSNPSIAAAAGARVERIAGQRALITSDGDVQIISANTYLVTISGLCQEVNKIAYANGINFQKLAEF